MSLPGAVMATGLQPASTWLEIARRRLALARWVQWVLLFAVGLGFALGALLGLDWLALVALFLAMIWVLLMVRSARLVGAVRSAWGAVQLGHSSVAEARAQQVLATQTLLRPAILGALVVLAAAARRQGRHRDAAQIAGFVLARSERLLVGDRNGLQLLLAESLLDANQLPAARAAALPLYGGKLPLPEALRLLSLQLRLEARLGAWTAMVDRLGAKVDMAELMSPPESALAQALLQVAAARTGMSAWAGWLRQRVDLLADWRSLASREPALAAAVRRSAENAPAAVEVTNSAPDAPPARADGEASR